MFVYVLSFERKTWKLYLTYAFRDIDKKKKRNLSSFIIESLACLFINEEKNVLTHLCTYDQCRG